MKNNSVSITDRRVPTETVLIAMAMVCGFGALNDAKAEVTSPTQAKAPVEKYDLQKVTNPRHFPPDVAHSGGKYVEYTLPGRPKSTGDGSHPIEVYGTDYTKHPPQPLKIGNQGSDAKIVGHVVDSTRTLHIVNANGKINPAYFSYLRNFHEVPFSEIKGVGKILRFVKVESDQKPILISVNFKTTSGTATITAKEIGKNNVLDHNETTELTADQVSSLLDKVNYPEVWKEIPYTKSSGKYSYWILESWDGKTYKSATQYLPTDGLIKELGDELIGLTNLQPAAPSTPATK